MPSSMMEYFAYFENNLFEDHVAFFSQWNDSAPDVIAALELVSIASKVDDSGLWNTGCQIRSWNSFIDNAARFSL